MTNWRGNRIPYFLASPNHLIVPLTKQGRTSRAAPWVSYLWFQASSLKMVSLPGCSFEASGSVMRNSVPSPSFD